MQAASAKRPRAVLFACGMNAIRSPMAASILHQLYSKTYYVASAGVTKGELDGFAVAVMQEIGLDLSHHRPATFDELEHLEGLNFDLIISLSPEAHHKSMELTRTIAVDVEYWPTANPAVVEGSREQRLEAYRAVRDGLMRRIRERFGHAAMANE
jgi:protein-tyrosine-phosphatase